MTDWSVSLSGETVDCETCGPATDAVHLSYENGAYSITVDYGCYGGASLYEETAEEAVALLECYYDIPGVPALIKGIEEIA